MSNLGFRVCKRPRVISPEIVQAYRGIPVSTVSDSMNRLSAGGVDLRPRHSGTYLSGAAFTVRTRPGDNLAVHLAIDLAGPGDVIVVDASGDMTNAIIGELMVILAAARGISGFVINGAIRDSHTIAGQDMPVYSTGITHRGPYKDGPGEINVPINLGGMVIEPGDLIIGDADGVLAIPYNEAARVLELAKKKVVLEQKTAAQFADQSADRKPILDRFLALGGVVED